TTFPLEDARTANATPPSVPTGRATAPAVRCCPAVPESCRGPGGARLQTRDFQPRDFENGAPETRHPRKSGDDDRNRMRDDRHDGRRPRITRSNLTCRLSSLSFPRVFLSGSFPVSSCPASSDPCLWT